MLHEKYATTSRHEFGDERMRKQILQSGWGKADITPRQKTLLRGQFYQRISTHTNDPLYANVLALQDTSGELLIWISFDLLGIEKRERQLLISELTKNIQGIKETNIICSCIHNHTGPYLNSVMFQNNRGGNLLPDRVDFPDDCLKAEDYVRQTLIPKTVDACKEACDNISPTGFSSILGHAVIGHCRRMLMRDGSAIMYGNCGDYNFDRPEGPSDHGIEMMYLYDEDKKLNGLIVNINCPAQALDRKYYFTADFIGLFRNLLKEKLGCELPVLTLIGAAGNISPRDYRNFVRGRKEEPDMWEMEGAVELSRRLLNCFLYNLEIAEKTVEYEIAFGHLYQEIQLPIRTVTNNEVEQADVELKKLIKKYNGELRELPLEDTKAYRYAKSILLRAEMQQKNTWYDMPAHAIRIGNSSFITNPFELYIEYGMRMRGRAKSLHTFIAQLTDDFAGYLPTPEAVKAGGYSTATGSCLVSCEGGELLTETSIRMINSLFD